MPDELLIKGLKDQSFNAFVSDVLELIRCDQWEQKQSGDYVGGQYFRCFALGVEITLARAEDAKFKGFGFLFQFRPELDIRGKTASLAGLADCIARKFASHGYEVVRPYDRQAGGQAMFYYENPDRGIRPWQQVIMEEVDGVPSQQYKLDLAAGGHAKNH